MHDHARTVAVLTRNAVIRSALDSGLRVRFEDLGGYRVRAWFSSDGIHWHGTPAEVERTAAFEPGAWAESVTCFGCGSRGPLDRSKRCRECARVAGIRGQR